MAVGLMSENSLNRPPLFVVWYTQGMTLEDVFHLTAIITFGLATLLLTSLVVLVFFMMKKLGRLLDNIDKRVEAVGKIVEDPGDAAVEFGASLVSGIVSRSRKWFS